MSPQIFAIQTEIDFLENLHWERSDPLAQSESNSLVKLSFAISFTKCPSKDNLLTTNVPHHIETSELI